MKNSKEIGIIILPDNETCLKANMLQDSCLVNLEKSGLIKLATYDKNYRNLFHMTLYQLLIESSNLHALCESIKKISLDLQSLSFQMNISLTNTHHNIFWNSDEAKDLISLKKSHEEAITEGNKRRIKSETFSRSQYCKTGQLTAQEILDIEEYGIFWGLPHNFMPHITVIYNLNCDKNNIRIRDCLDEVQMESHHLFHAKSIAIGELGPAGNVTSILEVIQ